MVHRNGSENIRPTQIRFNPSNNKSKGLPLVALLIIKYGKNEKKNTIPVL